MKIPAGMTEKQVVEIINTVATKLASKFKFGYHEIEDIKQQARVEAIKAMGKYDNKRPLENFLWVHVHNRLCNFKRDKYERLEKPCLTCPFYDKLCKKSDNQCEAFADKMECEKWAGYLKRNEAKKNLTQSIGIESFSDLDRASSNSTEQNIEQNELTTLLDKLIPIELRHDYVKMVSGVKLPKNKREKVQAAVREILENNGYF